MDEYPCKDCTSLRRVGKWSLVDIMDTPKVYCSLYEDMDECPWTKNSQESERRKNMNIIEKAFELLEIFNIHGYQAYMVGGASRDIIRGLPYSEIHDIDICTDCTPDEIIDIANLHRFDWFQEGRNGRIYGTVTIMFDSETPIQVTPYRTDKDYDGRHCSCTFEKDLFKDLERRDCAMNAIGIDRHWNIIDPYGGVQDIKDRIVRTIEEPAVTFKRDELRAMRVVRLATTLRFKIEHRTFLGLGEVRLSELSWERIHDELTKILESPNRLRGLILLYSTGLLEQILPEVTRLQGVKQDTLHHPEKDTFLHTLMCAGFLPDNATAIQAMGTILHDIGKPPTRVEDGDAVHFYEHENVGASMANDVMYRLKFTAEQAKEVTWLVQNHMRVYSFMEMKKSKKIEFINHPYFADLLEVLRADIMGSMGSPHEFLREIRNFMKEYEEEVKRRPALKTKLVNGDDVLKMMYGYIPKKVPSSEGIKIKEILESVNDEIAEGRINTREEALEFLWKIVVVNQT